MLTGRPEIWGRQDPPDPQLAMLGVLGDARDASCAFRFPIAVDGAVPGFAGFPVRRGLFGQAAAYQLTGQVIRLGQASGTSKDVAVPLRSLTRHALIAGSPGSGKTATAVEILRQLWADHAIPFLVIEPVNSDTDDYRKLAAEPGFEALEVITVGDEAGAPLRFNPFEVPPGMLVGEHVTNLLACFTVAFGLGGPLPSIYLDALNLTYLRAGFLFERAASRSQPCLAHRGRFPRRHDRGDRGPRVLGRRRGRHRCRLGPPRAAAGARDHRLRLPDRPAGRRRAAARPPGDHLNSSRSAPATSRR